MNILQRIVIIVGVIVFIVAIITTPKYIVTSDGYHIKYSPGVGNNKLLPLIDLQAAIIRGTTIVIVSIGIILVCGYKRKSKGDTIVNDKKNQVSKSDNKSQEMLTELTDSALAFYKEAYNYYNSQSRIVRRSSKSPYLQIEYIYDKESCCLYFGLTAEISNVEDLYKLLKVSNIYDDIILLYELAHLPFVRYGARTIEHIDIIDFVQIYLPLGFHPANWEEYVDKIKKSQLRSALYFRKNGYNYEGIERGIELINIYKRPEEDVN
jgi:hypothetical protein